MPKVFLELTLTVVVVVGSYISGPRGVGTWIPGHKNCWDLDSWSPGLSGLRSLCSGDRRGFDPLCPKHFRTPVAVGSKIFVLMGALYRKIPGPRGLSGLLRPNDFGRPGLGLGGRWDL